MTTGIRRGQGRLPLDVAAMYAAYQAEGDLAAVGRRFGCAAETVRRRFVAAGYPRRPALQYPGYRGADTAPTSYAIPLADHGDLPLHRPGCPGTRMARRKAAALGGWRVAAVDWQDLAMVTARPDLPWRVAPLIATCAGAVAAD